MHPSARRVNDLSLTREAPLNFGQMSTRAHRESGKRVRTSDREREGERARRGATIVRCNADETVRDFKDQTAQRPQSIGTICRVN